MKPIDKQIESYLYYCTNVKHMTEQTIENKTYMLHQFARESEISDMSELTNHIVNDWIAHQMSRTIRVKPVSASTINTRIKHLSAFVRWLRDNHDLSIPIKLGMVEKVREDPPRRTYYTREQIENVLTFADPTEKLMIQIKFDTGLRLNELRTLKLENIKGREITVIGKGRKKARVFITSETKKLLDRHIRTNRIVDWLWPSPHMDCANKPMSKDALRVKLGRSFKRAGIDDFYPHSLRHSFATDVQRNGAPTDVIKTLMRHSSVATTEVYLHNFDQFLINDYDHWRTPA